MLKKFCKKFFKGEKGFTLIELLIVVAILGVLAAVAIPNVSKFVGSGNLAAANTEVATVQTAAIAYAADHSLAPVAFTGVDLSATGGYLDKPLKGTYSFNSDGSINGTPTYPTLTWDPVNKQFIKP